MFGISEKVWEEKNGLDTAKEVGQQPDTWIKTIDIIKDNREKIEEFFSKYKEGKETRIIFTGAGTSAFVGEIVVPYLNENYNYRFEAISTTDIVSNPNLYLEAKTPTIIVSFARSGNSPESIGTYNLAEEIIENIDHIFITCNENGEMAKMAENSDNILALLMPDETNDKGLAMTSSFTNMMLSSLLIFDLEKLDNDGKEFDNLVKLAKEVVDNSYKDINEVIKLNCDRFVFLGSGCLKGIARESGLKILELTKGKTVSVYDSMLGFRHGPKSIVNDKTAIFMYISNEEYTRKYDVDMVKELYSNPGEHKIITISDKYSDELEEYSDFHWGISKEDSNLNDVYLGLVYIIYAQIFAVLSSLDKGLEPNNPSPDGAINRVVQGVTIYPYN